MSILSRYRQKLNQMKPMYTTESTSDMKAREKAKAINPREFVDLLDVLIKTRITQNSMQIFGLDTQPEDENSELIKRQLTDYLLAADSRAGIFVKGDNQ